MNNNSQRGFNEIVKEKDLDALLEATHKLCNYKITVQNVKLPIYIDRKDVAQDAMLKVFKAYRRFDPTKASANTYFGRIIDNVIVDHVRNSWNQITGQGFSRSADEISAQAYEQLADISVVVDDFYGRDKEDIAQQTINVSSQCKADFLFSELLADLGDTLTKREKEIFILRYEGYTHEEIAKKLGVSRPTVAKDWRRVRKIILDWIY